MEIWKDVKGYEGLYQVSNEGRVKSVENIRENRYGLTAIEFAALLKVHVTTIHRIKSHMTW
jgi:hypothetical protein